ncbi:MAG TPA: glycosyltransferase family 4 protein [Lapillicoccus sp.]|nr:glycosyltransferase family 4 protein [Lapillicoccus sp.]
MRVLHLVCSDRFAGVERHVALLAAAQRDAGATIAVIGGDEASMRRDIGAGVVFRPTGGLLQTVRTARPFVPGADIVHVHMTASEVAGVIAALGTTAAVVTTRHFAAARGSTPVNRWVGRRAAARIDAQIAVSAYAASYVEGDSTVVYAGVANRESVDPLHRQRTVLVAQRLEPEKRTGIALEAFAASGLARDGWRLVIAGGGSLRPALERKAGRLGIAGATRFLGHAGDVQNLMATAGLLLAPRPDEAYGLSVVEAMAVGLPVVAAAGGGHLETVGGVGGTGLFPPDDVRGAASALRALAADSAGRAAYGEQLRTAQRERFTLEAQQRETDAVYREVRG